MKKETIELVKRMIEDGNLSEEVAVKYYPELKESEDDKIRKALIKYLDALDDDEIRYEVSFKDMRTWLEKQGEQKPVDKVEPKFKAGDIIYRPSNSSCPVHSSIDGTL